LKEESARAYNYVRIRQARRKPDQGGKRKSRGGWGNGGWERRKAWGGGGNMRENTTERGGA